MFQLYIRHTAHWYILTRSHPATLKMFLCNLFWLSAQNQIRFLHVYGLNYESWMFTGRNLVKMQHCALFINSTYLEGSRPRLTWSAMSVGQVFLLSPSKTMHFVSSILFLARFSLSALTASGFHSQAKTRSAWAWMR